MKSARNKLENTIKGVFTDNKFSEDDINKIVEIFGNVVLKEIEKAIGSSINVDSNKLMSSFKILADKLFHPSNSIIMHNEKFFNKTTIMHELVQITLSRIYDKLKTNIRNAIEKEKQEYKESREAKMKVLEEEFKAKFDSQRQGIHLATEMTKKAFNFVLEKNLGISLPKIDNIFFDVLKSPQNLIELAYRESFGAYNYENVFKYCKDINRFCLEIAMRYSKHKVDSLTENLLCQASMQLNKLFENTWTFLEYEFDLNKNLPSTHEFINMLYEESASTAIEYFEKLETYIKEALKNTPGLISEVSVFVGNLKNKISKKDDLAFGNNFAEFKLKLKLNASLNEEYESKAALYFMFADFFRHLCCNCIDSPINGDSLELFVNSFKEAINKDNGSEFTNRCNVFREDFKQRVAKELENKIKFYLGCDSTCPGCGPKCHSEKGHIGNHQSNKHIFKAFFNWKYTETNEPITEFCWEEKRLYRSKLTDENDNEYENSREYLKECHNDWFFDVEHNYFKYGRKILWNEEARQYRNEVIKAWMNARKPFIKRSDGMIDRNDYPQDWLCWIDNDKELKEDFVPKWKNKF
jgi:hypothetical protein